MASDLSFNIDTGLFSAFTYMQCISLYPEVRVQLFSETPTEIQIPISIVQVQFKLIIIIITFFS